MLFWLYTRTKEMKKRLMGTAATIAIVGKVMSDSFLEVQALISDTDNEQ